MHIHDFNTVQKSVSDESFMNVFKRRDTIRPLREPGRMIPKHKRALGVGFLYRLFRWPEAGDRIVFIRWTMNGGLGTELRKCFFFP